MNIGVITLYTDNIKELALSSIENHRYYCKINKYDYILLNGSLSDRFLAWDKILALKKYLLKYDYLLWIDSDAIFKNLNKKIEDYILDDSIVIIGKDPNKDIYANSGVFLLKNNSEAITFLDEVWNSPVKVEENNYSGWLYEQGIICELLKENKYKHYIVLNFDLNCHLYYYKDQFIIHYMGARSNAERYNEVINEIKSFNRENKFKEMTGTIFIQIASYRDLQLILTIENCISNAKHLNKLRFGIAWQHDESDKTLYLYYNDSRFKITDIDCYDSKGCCWARNKLQKLYDHEEYTLQIDSHMRFAKNWDSKLISDYKKLQKRGFKKPLITSYVLSFNLDKDLEERVNALWILHFDKFTEDGILLFLLGYIENLDKIKTLIKNYFYSAHFAFTTGLFCEEVKHDLNLYFHGEEFSIGLRAYTNGYDLFCLINVYCWHEYTRKGRIKQWDDDKEWWKKDSESKSKLRKLFRQELGYIINDLYGLGNERTLNEFIIESGVDVINKIYNKK